MSNIDGMTDSQLQTLRELCRDVLTGLVASLDERPDLQDAIRQMMAPDDMLETFSQIRLEYPDLARLTLQTAIASLVNIQSVIAIDNELQRRAEGN